MKRRRIIWIIILVCYVAFIYSNSLAPAIESSKASSGVRDLVLDALGKGGLDGSWISEYIIRKTAHFLEYAGLGVILYHCFFDYLAVIFGFFIPFADETIQLFVEGRSGQISDVWLDMFGVISGFICMWLLYTLIRKANPPVRA